MMILPYFEELSTQYPNVVFAKVDVDEVDESILETACINAMPTFQWFKSEKKVDELRGAIKDELKSKIEEWQ